MHFSITSTVPKVRAKLGVAVNAVSAHVRAMIVCPEERDHTQNFLDT
jgi:hypothetical protein